MPAQDKHNDAAVLLAKLCLPDAVVVEGMEAVSKHDQEIGSLGRARRHAGGIPGMRQERLNLTGSDRESDLNAPLDIAFNVAESDGSQHVDWLHKKISPQISRVLH
jgi:hypothetical protein